MKQIGEASDEYVRTRKQLSFDFFNNGQTCT